MEGRTHANREESVGDDVVMGRIGSVRRGWNGVRYVAHMMCVLCPKLSRGE